MTSISGVGAYMPQATSGASKRMSPDQMFTQLFQQIDTSNTGSITEAQFEAAFQNIQKSTGTNTSSTSSTSNADAIWSKLDPNNTGSVSKADFVSGMEGIMSKTHHHRHHGGGGSTSSASNGGNQWNSPAATLSDSLLSLLSTTGSTTS